MIGPSSSLVQSLLSSVTHAGKWRRGLPGTRFPCPSETLESLGGSWKFGTPDRSGRSCGSGSTSAAPLTA